MNHKLYLSAALVLTSSSMWGTEPITLPNISITQLSANGEWALSDNGAGGINVIEVASQTSTSARATNATATSISNDGSLVGTVDGVASVWTADEGWTALPLADDMTGTVVPTAISADGKVICGYASAQALDDYNNGLLYAPVVWYSTDGVFSTPQWLPYPATDYTGRTPKRVTALTLNADGSLIAGQVTPLYGDAYNDPIIFTTASGETSWEYVLPESLIDESVTLPEWPGDWVAPQAADFIVENLDQYLADLAASSIGWVNPDDYLTDEEKAAYAAAQEEANTAYKKWISKYNSYMNTIQEALETNYQFQQGILRLSDNGRYLMANTKVYDFEKEIDYTIPTLIDVDTRATKRYNDSRKLTPTYVANDGTMLASRTTVMGYVKGFIAPISGDSFVEIYDFVAEQDETLAAWMKTNMTHLVSDMEYDSENERWVNIGSELLVGYPTADAELSLLASWLYNTWSEETITYSYILDFSSLTAIHTVAIDSNIAIKASKGQLTIKGDAALVNVVDLQGRQAWSRKAIHGEASATLPSGLYIVTVTDSEGHTSSRKISL